MNNEVNSNLIPIINENVYTHMCIYTYKYRIIKLFVFIDPFHATLKFLFT